MFSPENFENSQISHGKLPVLAVKAVDGRPILTT